MDGSPSREIPTTNTTKMPEKRPLPEKKYPVEVYMFIH